MLEIGDIVAKTPVIPVVTIARPADAVPLARALVKGGLPVLEVTLRTKSALEALRRIADSVPKAIVGAGTLITPDQFVKAKRCGAQFAVSPGYSLALGRAAAKSELAYLPGIQTVSEAMAVAEHGYNLLKFFPAGAAGGPDWLKSVAAPLAGLKFCPTGGIDAESAPAYLALPNVVCVGGSWVAPKEAISAGDWKGIESLAAAAALLRH
jgi:2-dehydro-3-deoxyphosphogluconate aldolase / (4S)-4-hydroxy-2-oxoglutarate aldolase